MRNFTTASQGSCRMNRLRSKAIASIWVQLNKRTKTAIDGDDHEIVRFLLGFSSKKGMDIETIFLDE